VSAQNAGETAGERMNRLLAEAGIETTTHGLPNLDEHILATSGGRPFDELRESGLLWLINRTVFHPRGFALGLVHGTDGKAIGWTLLGDGKEPWRYASEQSEDRRFAAAEATLQAAKENPR
jgi:hypothetical protein